MVPRSPAVQRLLARASRHGPWLSVALLSAWLLWPVPLGAMPMSADHTVHLTRIWMWAGELMQGNLRGWSTIWFFGTPVGELYPVLGDAVIIAVRVASVGALSWSGAYALGFFGVFAIQGWALIRIARSAGISPWAGVAAAALLLCDAGAYREGGWLYTVSYGVWPQALSTALTWLAFGEVLAAWRAEAPPQIRRALARAALAFGASLLAHPMAMLSTAIGGPLLLVVLGMSGRRSLRKTAGIATVAVALGIAVAAWWLVPMLSHRGWMASYGWMWRSLSWMGAQAMRGHYAQTMPTAVGTGITAGIVLVAVAGARPARFLVAYGLVLWVCASKDVLWHLRLDQLSDGFAHIQYQRFIIAAKPGLYLAAGIGGAMLVQWGLTAWRVPKRTALHTAAAAVGLGVPVAGALWMASDLREPMRKYGVGEVQVARVPDDPQREADFDALTHWAKLELSQSEQPWRMTFAAPRNAHWFMDAPTLTEGPTYKQGFTPGDNFVHKPESGQAAVLDRLGVRYVVRDRPSRKDPVAQFGALRVFERPRWRAQPTVWLVGPGTLTLETLDIENGLVTGSVSGTDSTTRIVFAIGGFPRWSLTQGGAALTWYEVPVVGDGPLATQAERRAGALRGGKADGDDGTEPTLLAADIGDGPFQLRYRTSTARDIAALLVSLLALALCIGLLTRGDRGRLAHRWLAKFRPKVAILGHPVVLAVIAAAAVLFAVVRWRAGHAAEARRAVGWVADGRATVEGRASTRLFKTDMLIQPAVVVPGRRKGPTSVTFDAVTLGETLDGWVAIDDDASKMRREGRHTITLEVDSDAGWQRLKTWKVPHRGGTTEFSLPLGSAAHTTAAIRVEIRSDGEKPPPVAFDLHLGDAPGG